jgi:hypothetical protein
MDGPPVGGVNGVTIMVSAWAVEEFESLDLGDERLDDRAAVVLSAMGNRPNLSIPAACGGNAEMAAAYRFFDNEKVSFEKVLEPHTQRTRQRMAEHDVVLLVQDTSEIDLTRPQQTVTGAGELDGSRKGLLLHVMHGFTSDGTPLGTVWARVVNRPSVSHASDADKRDQARRTPIEQKESMRWLEGMRQSRMIAASLPQVQCICVSDSESDIYECICESRAAVEGGPPVHDWVIRACHDRALLDDPEELRRMREKVLAKPVLYTAQVQVRQRKAMTEVEKRARRKVRCTREAQVEIRAAMITLRAPKRNGLKLPAIMVNMVLVHEPNPPAGAEPIVWMLLTTLPIETPEQVRLIVQYYCLRWNIEILFRTLKSGCRIEERRFEDVERILPCMAIYLIASWRVLLACRLGRECPDADCEVLFEPSEWKATWMAVHRRKPPKKNPTLSEIVCLIAQLGGYIRRPSSEPGVQTLWIGMQRVRDLALAWEAFGPEKKIRRE